jgi:hypothetical protein
MIKIGILLIIHIILSLSESNTIPVLQDCGLKSMVDGDRMGPFDREGKAF